MNVSSVEVTMSSVQHLRELISDRLTAAAEEIFSEFERTIVQYEEEIDRQRRQLDNIWKPQIRLHTTDLPLQHVCKEEEVLTGQQLCNQETNSSLDQEDPKPPQIKEEPEKYCTNLNQGDPEHPQMKEEQEELCNNQEGEKFVLNQKKYSFVLTQCESKCKDLSGEILRVSETTNVHYEEQIDGRLMDIIWKPQIKLHRIDCPKKTFCNEQDVLADHQLCNKERNSSQDQEDQEHSPMKDAQEELFSSLEQEDPEPSQTKEQEEQCSSQEGEKLGLKQETDGFMVTPISEESDHSKPEPNSDRLLSHSNPFVENTDQERGKHAGSGSKRNVEVKPKKTHHRKSSHRNNVDSSSLSESHCDTDTGKKSLTCDVCGKNFKYKFSLKRHYDIHTGVKTFACRTCGKRFRQSHHLTVHVRTHSDEKLYLCNTCGKRFYGLNAFKRHIAIHRDDKPYSCQICEKSFSHQSSLSSHMMVHTGERPYSCQTCGKKFVRRCDLATHIRIHTGEKPYPCKTCGKNFSCKHKLLCHVRIHTGEKLCSCKTCGKSFTRTDSLLVHMRIHTGEKPYLCNTCGKRFNDPSSFRNHTTVHTGVKRHICNTCGKRLASRSSLKRHVAIHTAVK